MSTRRHGTLWHHLLHEHGKLLPKADLSHVPPDAEMKRQMDGSRVLVTINDARVEVIVGYVHGPDFRDELRRLGIRTRFVRFRQVPLLLPAYTSALHPPELDEWWDLPIPEELRGRTGTFVTDPHAIERQPGWYYKYAATGLVRLHRPRWGQRGAERKWRKLLMVPLVWLEGAECSGLSWMALPEAP